MKQKRALLVAFFVVLTVFPLSQFAIKNFDLGFHLQSGRTLAETGQWLSRDQATFTRADQLDYPHSLVPAYLFYQLFKIGQFPLLILFKGLVISLGIVLIFLCATHVYRSMRAQNEQPSWFELNSLFFLVIAAGVFARDRFLLQPFIFTDFFLYTWIFLISWYLCHPKKETKPVQTRFMIGAALVFLIWFQLHLGVVMGLGALGLFLSSLLWARRFDLLKSFLKTLLPLVLLLGLVSAAVNPSSRNIWPHLIFEMQNSLKQSFVAEYQSAWRFYPKSMLLFLCSGLFVSWHLCRRHLEHAHIKFLILLFWAFLGLASLYQREIAHCAMIWSVLMAAGMGQMNLQRIRRAWVLSPVVLALLLVSLSLKNPRFLPKLGLDLREVPLEAFHTLAELHPKENFYNSMRYGGWWQFFYPNQGKIFHDGRGPLYPAKFFKRAVQPILEGQKNTWAVFDQYQINLALVDVSESICGQLFQNPAWGVQYFDDRAAIFKRGLKKGQLNPCVDDQSYFFQEDVIKGEHFPRELAVLNQVAPKNLRYGFIESLRLVKLGKSQEALTLLVHLSQVRETRLNLWGNTARLACNLKNYAKAHEAFDHGQFFLGHSHSFWRDRTMCLRQEGRSFQAFWVGLKGLLFRVFLRFS